MEPEEANIGFVRKLLTDAVLQRSLDRNNQSQPLYIESEDADLIEVDKRTVFNLISKLDKTLILMLFMASRVGCHLLLKITPYS